MGTDHWPLFDLEIRTPRLTLRYLDDELATELVGVAVRGVHDPAVMPFAIPWTDLPSPQMEQEALRFYWRTRASVRPQSWNLQFAVIVKHQVVGACDVGADDFSTLRQVTTGSWLGREFQGQGLGKEFRMAALTLGFDGLGADLALTGMWHDNHASRGVTESLGYEFEGRRMARRRDAADEMLGYRMSRAHWTTIRRDDITLHGLDAAREFLGVRPRSDPGALPALRRV
jgi:RimJ/RimL family protein N-acetyltransferase